MREAEAEAEAEAAPARLRVAAAQMTSTEDVSANLATAARLVREAASAGARLVGLPENFAFLGSDRDHRLAIAETLPAPDGGAAPGPILGAMIDVARASGVHLLLGGFPERSARNDPLGNPGRVPGPSRDGLERAEPVLTQRDRIHNTAVLIAPDGAIAARYRKIHLFDVDVPGGMRFRESDAIDPGGDVVVAPLPWGGLGLSICYDLRFPELYRRLTAAGARILAVPSAFTAETGKDHWHVLLRARAIENQAFVLAPAQFGHHGGARRSYGHAMVIDPWGVVLAECGNHEGVAIAECDFAYQDSVRRDLPCLAHRRI